MTALAEPVVDRPMSTDEVATSFHRLYQKLASLGSLEPAPVVDSLFGNLVHLVVDLAPATHEDLLADPIVQAIRPRLHQLCAAGETLLERRWADAVVASADPHATLASFPYQENYRQLTLLEWHAMASVSERPPRRVAFVGSGSLPLSSLLFASTYGVTVDNIDVDGDALDRSRRVAEVLGADLLGFCHADVRDCDGFDQYDVVVLAALVGLDHCSKRQVVRHLQQQLAPGSLLVARSAHGARSLLYPVLDLSTLAPLELLAVLHPYSQVINSVVLARKPDARSGES